MDELKMEFETSQIIVIKIGEEQYGINIQNIENIVRMQHITRVPKVSEYLKGVINLRGEVIPVMSIRIKMNLEEDVFDKATRIIILKVAQQETTGVIVDEVLEVVTLEASQIEKVSYNPNDEKTNFIYGIGKYEGGLISLLDLNSLLTEKENL